ncbi:hypothetical protein [Streptomyces griseoaurantiacus]|uniref:DUF3987 domain-containing protein n=1 Tax=Streptomyces griseoaurantiacus TaxID=68213 RepID=A0A7W2DSK4_9ACTN|nr:hypothetical protein [Streptomyces griseoaurantiacus]MBA5222239.1 hypothetical protein [Streptomyces griseoaurantiacus]
MTTARRPGEWPPVAKPGKKPPEPPRFEDIAGQASVYDYVDEPEPRVNTTTGEIFEPGEEVDEPTVAMPRGLLPEEFWASRAVFQHIRQAAHSQCTSGEVAFYTVLARLSATISHRIKANTGMRGRASLNTFVAIVGPSSAGKSTGKDTGSKLLQIPDREFRDDLSLGTGEGIAETFMGTVEEEVVGPDGQPKKEPVRKQVRHNAFFYADEGEVLTKVSGRQGSTIGETIRRAAGGEALGQTNAEAARNRHIPKGGYAMGMVVGFQPETALPLLQEAHLGTPQRFLWSPVIDPAIPERIQDKPEWPGVLEIQPQFWDPQEDLDITFPVEVQQELWDINIARSRGEVEVGELDGHEQLTRIKVSALLALLDFRQEVNLEDWELSKVIWDASCSLRNALLEKAKRDAIQKKQQNISDHVEMATRAESAKREVEDAIERIARSVHRKVKANPMTLGALRKSLASRDRDRLMRAVDHAAAKGWVIEEGGEVRPGDSEPANGK